MILSCDVTSLVTDLLMLTLPYCNTNPFATPHVTLSTPMNKKYKLCELLKSAELTGEMSGHGNFDANMLEARIILISDF